MRLRMVVTASCVAAVMVGCAGRTGDPVPSDSQRTSLAEQSAPEGRGIRRLRAWYWGQPWRLLLKIYRLHGRWCWGLLWMVRTGLWCIPPVLMGTELIAL